jgi:hypothetical protein
VINLFGGFEGISNLMSEVAILKMEHKMMKLEIQELQKKLQTDPQE